MIKIKIIKIKIMQIEYSNFSIFFQRVHRWVCFEDDALYSLN